MEYSFDRTGFSVPRANLSVQVGRLNVGGRTFSKESNFGTIRRVNVALNLRYYFVLPRLKLLKLLLV